MIVWLGRVVGDSARFGQMGISGETHLWRASTAKNIVHVVFLYLLCAFEYDKLLCGSVMSCGSYTPYQLVFGMDDVLRPFKGL